jgi:DNA-binding NarL/FixJ family response regulator
MLHTRIVLVDDHRILLDALRSLVEPEFEVVGTFENAHTMLENIAGLRPDIVVLDISMPVMDGLSAADHLKKLLPKVKLVFLTSFEDRDTAAEAFKLGASGYVLKVAAATELMSALREVDRGGFYASPVLTDGMVGSFVKAFKQMKSPHNLTPRQREVLKLLAAGNSMKSVGETLNITPRTVAFHKYTIMQQLNVKTNSELINYALSHLQ